MANDLVEIGINVKSNADAAYKGLNTLNGAVVNSIKSAERLEKNYALLDKAVAKKKITLEQYAKGVQQTDAAIASLQQRMNDSSGGVQNYGRHVNQARGYTNQFGLVTQQVGYQFGDLAVQIQSGTNAFVAIGQQFTQLAGLGAQLSKSMAMIGVFTGLGIAIPIITGILAYMTRTKDKTEETVDVFQRLTEATKQLGIERAKALDSSFDENLVGTKDRLQELTKAYEDAKNGVAAYQQSRTVAPGLATDFLVQSYVSGQEQDAALALVEAEKELVRYKGQRADAQARAAQEAVNEIGAQRELNEVILKYGEDSLEVKRKQAELDKRAFVAEQLKAGITGYYLSQVIAAYEANVQLEQKIDDAAEKARILAEAGPSSDWLNNSIAGVNALISRLGIGIQAAGQLRVAAAGASATALPMTMAPSDPTGWAENSLGFVDPSKLIYNPPSTGGGGGGGGVASPDALEALLKRVELEKELLGTSEAYKEVMQAIKGSDKEYSDAAIQGAVARLEALNKEKEVLQQMEEQHKQIGDILESSMTSAFMSMIDGTKSVKDAFRDMARDIIKQLYEIIVVKRMVNAITGALGFANGGAFSAGRQIQAYANGGVVGGPTYFPMAGGKTGLMGEAGPEAIMPLKRGRGGKLGVSVEGASGSVNVVNNINVTGGSDPAAIRAEVAKLMPQITSATKSAVIDARRRGGQMKAAFG